MGKGTFGEAWLVLSKASGRSYVMKEMCTGSWDEKEKEQSMNEVNILASCNHVNIVRYAGAYITLSRSLYHPRESLSSWMEFADAGDLSMLIKKQKYSVKLILPEADILSWVFFKSPLVSSTFTRRIFFTETLKPRTSS